MTSKERILSAIKGQEADRMPWSPFLAYWWEAQPESLRMIGQLQFMERIHADPILRGFCAPYKIRWKQTQIETIQQGEFRREVWRTPVGQLTFIYRYSRGGDTWFLTGHPIQDIQDLKILQWIYEHAEIEADSGADKLYAEIGDRGLSMPVIGSECKTCFQSLVEKWIGTEKLVYFLADEPQKIQTCLDTMRYISDRTAKYCAAAESEAFIFWEDSSTTNISPAMFETYAAPEIRKWGEVLHASGKLLIHHACGCIRALLPAMARTGIDAVESISPPPTGNVDIGEAFHQLPEHIALIGGIEPVFFQECTRDALQRRVQFLLRQAKGRRFVLANSDSCPPGVEEWKFGAVSDCVANLHGVHSSYA